MHKIKDRITLGAISGIIAGVFGRLLNAIQYKLGLTDISSTQLATPIFIPKNKADTPEGIALSEIINSTNTGAIGVLMAYMFSLTGRDKAIMKGIGVGALSWVLLQGVASGLGLKVKSNKPLTPILGFFNHALYGSLCAYFITNLGNDNLFPDPQISKQEKVPVVYTGTTQNGSIDILVQNNR